MGNTGGRERSQPPVDDSGPTVLQTRINYANRANDGDMSFRVWQDWQQYCWKFDQFLTLYVFVIGMQVLSTNLLLIVKRFLIE